MTRGRVFNTTSIKKIVLTIITVFFLEAGLHAQNYALDLDGINDYVSTPIDADLQAMPSTTWSGWIKPTGVSGWQIIFGMEDGGWDRMLVIENGGLSLSMGHTNDRWQTGASVNPGVWQHVVAIYDNGSMTFYLNGVQYTSSTSEGSHFSSGTFTIGANQSGGGNFYKGLIDDVALWNEALTAAEITALYNAGSGLNAAVNSGYYTSSSNLVGYWRMNEGSGSTLTDGSGNSNSGTLVNMDINDWVLNLTSVSKYGSFSNTNYNYVDRNGKEGGALGLDKYGKQEYVLDGIITSGLVMHLDAGNAASYSGSGTTWTDISGNGKNGTLVNGPTYNSSNRGSIVFDGTDDYVNCGSPSLSSGKITVSAWVKITTGSKFQHIVDCGANAWHIAILNDNRPYFYNGSSYHTNAAKLTVGQWYMITGIQGTTLDIYINGVLSQSIASNVNVSNNTLNLGRWQSSPRYLTGNIAQVSIYNRALSAAEVLHNFNSTKSVFGL